MRGVTRNGVLGTTGALLMATLIAYTRWRLDRDRATAERLSGR